MKTDTLGHRIFLAHNAIERRLGRKVGHTLLGKLVAATEDPPRATPYTAGNVSRWERDEKRPLYEAISALADLAGFRKGWVAFGEGEMEADEESRAASDAKLQAMPLDEMTPIGAKGQKKRASRRAGAANGNRPSQKKGARESRHR